MYFKSKLYRVGITSFGDYLTIMYRIQHLEWTHRCPSPSVQQMMYNVHSIIFTLRNHGVLNAQCTNLPLLIKMQYRTVQYTTVGGRSIKQIQVILWRYWGVYATNEKHWILFGHLPPAHRTNAVKWQKF